MDMMDVANTSLGRRCQLKIYHHRKGSDGQVFVQATTNPFTQAEVADDDSSYALVIHGLVGDNNQLEKVTLRVNSALLVNVFRQVIGTYPNLPTDFSSPFTLESPFEILLHHWVDLDLRRRATEDHDEHKHLDLLFDFMNRQIRPERERMLAMTSQNQISFSNAWTIFRPGDLVYKEYMGHPWLLLCQKTAYDENENDGKFLDVHCTYTDSDGVDDGDVQIVITIYQKESFGADNPAVITDLPVYPRRYFKKKFNPEELDAEEGKLEERLFDRGIILLRTRNGLVQAYKGLAQYLHEPPTRHQTPHTVSSAVWVPYTEQGRIILDPKTFHEDHHWSSVRVQANEDPDPRLCPPYMIGFSLSRKEWCRFFVDYIRAANWQNYPWKSLILSESAERDKLVLRSLVTRHRFPDDARDQMRQRGRGLVILLHGTPGSGKTFTAETAAEGTKKALIMISLSELNSSSSVSFEHRLSLLLRYATIWKATVVLEEADMFVDSNMVNAARNSLEASFLRQLEYFGGIAFLITNPIKSFDRAMETRIHLALEYSPPDIEVRERLWDHMLNAIPNEEHSLNIRHTSEDLAMVRLNGRQIANAIHTARTIARSEDRVLKLRHLNMVLYYCCKPHESDWFDAYNDPQDPWVLEDFFKYPWTRAQEDSDEA